jgi:putative hydrolase of the HAD superfamily
MSITTIVFDFGNVVGFFSRRRAAEQLAAYTHLPAADIEAYVFGGPLEDDYEAGRISSADHRRRLCERFHLSCTEDQFAVALADMFTPNPEVCDLIPALKPRYRLLLLSNTNELHARQFRSQFADTLAWFDALVLSYEVGVRKPSPEVYTHCQRLAGCPAKQCLFIDDIAANVEGARACGWQGLVYRPGTLRRELRELGVVPAARAPEKRR